MADVGVDKTDFSGLIAKIEAFNIVAGEFFESAVFELNGVGFGQAGQAFLDQEGSRIHRESFGQVPIMRENATAVADGKNRGNEFQVVVFATLFNLIQALEKFRG